MPLTLATERKDMKISPRALDQARVRPQTAEEIQAASIEFRRTYPVAPVPPWVPKHQDVQVAMDSAIDPYLGYAGNWGSYGGGEYWPGFPYLAELTQRAEYRVITETRAKEMTRKWIRLTYQGDEDDEQVKDRIDKLNEALENFHVRDLFRKLAEQDGFYGGGHLYIDTGASDKPGVLATPLVISKETIPKGALKGLYTVEPIWVYPNSYNANDPLRADYFTPQTWFVMGKMVHRTRLLTMVSAEMPDIFKPAYAFRGLSLSQRAQPYVQNWLRTRQSVSDLVHSFSIVVLKTLLQAQVAAGADWSSVFTRLDVFNQTRDNRGAMVIDKETEEMDILAVPLSGLDALQAQSQEQMASVSQIPLVKLLGVQPAGLNSTSEGEIRVFYDNIHAMQEHLYRDPLTRVLDILQLHLFGDIDPDVGFEFLSLYEMDEAGQALVQKTEADIDAIYMQEGTISQEEVRTRLASDPKSQYYGLSLDPEDLPEPDDLMAEGESGMELRGDPAKQAEPREEARSAV